MRLTLKLLSVIGLTPTAMLCASQAGAASYQVIVNILSPDNGGVSGPLAADSIGNLYGEIPLNRDNAGQIFSLSVKSGYSRINILQTYSITNQLPGADPYGGITLDHANLIGTTSGGGTGQQGTAFNLGKVSNPVVTVLHLFNNEQTSPTDGVEPASGLVAGPSHLFYGTTYRGGSGKPPGRGTVYYISDSTTAPIYRVIHRFGGPGDGINPTDGHLVVDNQGRLYGETFLGGLYNGGTVFMIQKTDAGWQEQAIYSFPSSGNSFGGNTYGNVVLDNAGDLYGCAAGGVHNQGQVFRLAPPSVQGGVWQESVLYNFGDQPNDPVADLDSMGCNVTIDPETLFIVGTSAAGGVKSSGTIWQLKPPAAGQSRWHEAVDHSFFGGLSQDGGTPRTPPLQVGKTYYGGNTRSGAIYAFTPDY